MKELWAAISRMETLCCPSAGSGRSPLKCGGGEGVMEEGWCLPLLLPIAFPDWPYLLPQTLLKLWAAPACSKPEQMAAMWENTPCYAVDFWDRKHCSRNVWWPANSLDRDFFQAGCKRAVGLLKGGKGAMEMPAAEAQCSPAWIATSFTVREKQGLKCEIKKKAKTEEKQK